MLRIKQVAEYLEGKKGEKSSKRLSYIFSLSQLVMMLWVVLIWLLAKEKFDLALEVVLYFGGAVLFMGGFVVAEEIKHIRGGKKSE
jgi:hypothetical protein